MMEVSQNVELKELSTEGALLRTISTDVSSDVEPLSTPAILNKSSRRSSRDEEDLGDLTNGQDLPVQDVGKSKTVTDGQERNAGSDLDDLLDKISSIVDCSPKNLDELDSLDKSEECDSVSTKEKTADDIDGMQLEAIGEDEKHEEKEEEGAEEEEVVEEGENKNVELNVELESMKEPEEVVEDIEESPQEKEIEDIEETIQDKELENIKESVQQEEIEEVDALPEAEEEESTSKIPANLNTSKDDVFEDALDNISSSDEFDGFGSQDSKKVEPSKKPNTAEKPSVADDLEEISSDDDIIPRVEKVEKSARTEKLPDEGVIDLDSSNECVVCDSPTEDKESKDVKEDKESKDFAEDKEEVPDSEDKLSEDVTEDKESKDVTEPKESEAVTEPKESEAVTEPKESEAVTEDQKEVAKVDTEDTAVEAITVEKETETCSEDKEAETATKDPEEVVEKVDTEEVKESTVEESAEKAKEEPLEADKESEKLEGVQEGDPKSTEESGEVETKPIETMLVEDEEPTTDPKEDGKEHKEYRTSTQEMNDTTIDDLLLEVGQESFETEENKKSEEDDDEPMVIPENEEEPKVNGVSEKSSEGEADKTGKPEKHDVSKEKHIPGKETKETESDDEVIFFEPIDKTKADDTAAAAPAEEKKKLEAPSTETDKDDDVVLVSEDEDEEPSKEPVKSAEKEAASEVISTDSKPKESAADKDLLVDNTDNACDQFDKPKTHDDKVKSAATEDGNSNSSSSSLLRPAESADQPKSKRVRLSADEKINSSFEAEAGSLLKPASEEEEMKLIAKRSHDHVESSPVEEKEEIPNKKLKTDDSDSNSSSGTLHIDLDEKDEEGEPIKELEEMEPKLELKPVPEIKTDVKPLRLEFLKNFRRSFDTLTRDDLEELVLQKVVEAMLVKSEFADIRTQLDKCETTLATYRRKIAEVSKQFLDLDTVHKRVLKDLESKNSHFTAPVRITRAVGLQVGIPFKAMKPTVAVQDQSQHAAGSMLAPPSGTPPKASTSPMRSPMRARPALPGPASNPPPATSPSASNQSQGPNLQQQQARSNASFGQQPSAAAIPGTQPVRRGCLQKVTPQRPNPTVSQANNLQNMHRLQGSPPSGGLTRGMHASKHTGSTTGMASSAVVAAAAAKAAAMRSRNASNASAYMAQKQQQQQQQLQQQQQQQQQQQYQTHRPGPASSSSSSSGSGPGPSPAKQSAKCATKVHAQGPPIAGATVSVPSGAGSYGQQQQPSLAPAKPKEKAVIDLTDEDDAAAAAAAAAAQAAQAAQATIEANARLRQAANNAVKRNAQAAAASRGGGRGGRGGANVVRASPMQLARVNARQIVQNNGAGQRSSVGSNITMQIRSENTPPAASRLRYSHPAPLPSSPPQPFNPAWKMPPSRPVIRISLLDTGIVISWTLEDTRPRYAECVTYQIYAYQETIHEPSTDSWRHVGDVKAMLLPMAVTLNQFQENQRYYFAVRGVDDHQRFGPFSVPKTWS